MKYKHLILALKSPDLTIASDNIQFILKRDLHMVAAIAKMAESLSAICNDYYRNNSSTILVIATIVATTIAQMKNLAQAGFHMIASNRSDYRNYGDHMEKGLYL